MKCYFTFNNDIENNKTYLNMLETALKTARENTTLDLHALYEGNPEDKLYLLLKKYDVKVSFCKLSFYNLLESFYDQKYNESCGFKNLNLKQVACNFMKFEIPLFEKDDEVVLYSDIDTIFLKDINNFYTKTLKAAPEFAQQYDIIKGNRYFNAGIMVLNLKELEKRKKILIEKLKNKERPYQECWDQGFFNELYKNDFEELPLEYNWKPYWGINNNACIVHLHGFKPFNFNSASFWFCKEMLGRFNDGFAGLMYYFTMYCSYIPENTKINLTNLAEFLLLAKMGYKRRWRFLTFYSYIFSKIIKKYKLKLLYPVAKFLDKNLEKKNILKGTYEEFEKIQLLENSPLVSVIIPAYNHENYIQETIKSIINQTYQNIELLIIDDGSKDSTWNKIQEMKPECEKRFANIHFETKENEGSCKTLNKLITLSKGEYIYLIASDDISKPDAIKKEVEFLSKNKDYAFCVGNDEYIDQNSKVCYLDKNLNYIYDIKKAKYKNFAEFYQQLKRINFNSDIFGKYHTVYSGNYIPNGYMIRKSIFEKTGLFTPEAPLEDYYMNMQIAKYSKMKYLDEILFSYRVHPANTMKNIEKMNFMTQKTLEYEQKLLENTDFSMVDKEVQNVYLNGAFCKKKGIPFIFEILKYKKYDKNLKKLKTKKFIKILGIVVNK